ncbi:hypothetical protein ACFL5M_03020 [Candidatus Neomarinimicrobiota bacterium]
MKRSLCILIAITLLRAEGPAIGGYAGAFSQIGTDARSVALAGALVADINSGYLALTNPASLVYVQRREVGLSLMTLPLERSLQSLSFATSLPPTAAVSLSYIRAGDDNIQGRNSIGEPTEVLTYSDNLVMLSFANQYSQNLSMGLNAKLLFINLGDESSRGFALDLGFLYRHATGLALALKLQNVTGAYSWKVATSPGERLYVDYLPFIVNSGIRLPWRHYTFLGQADLVIPKVKESEKAQYKQPVPIFRGAVEDLLRDRYFIRLGIENTTFTLGAGLRYSVRQPFDSRIDYSLSLGKTTEGMGHFFSWIFSL